MELAHQVEGDDDLRVFHLVLNHIHDDVQRGDAKVVMVKVYMRTEEDWCEDENSFQMILMMVQMATYRLK